MVGSFSPVKVTTVCQTFCIQMQNPDCEMRLHGFVSYQINRKSASYIVYILKLEYYFIPPLPTLA